MYHKKQPRFCIQKEIKKMNMQKIERNHSKKMGQLAINNTKHFTKDSGNNNFNTIDNNDNNTVVNKNTCFNL